MTFGDAMVAMQNGLKVFRPAWDQLRAQEKGAYLALVKDPAPARNRAIAGSADGIPVIKRFTGPSDHVGSPFMSSSPSIDLNAEIQAVDWEIRQ